jgi:hypothetical protein
VDGPKLSGVATLVRGAFAVLAPARPGYGLAPLKSRDRTIGIGMFYPLSISASARGVRLKRQPFLAKAGAGCGPGCSTGGGTFLGRASSLVRINSSRVF